MGGSGPGGWYTITTRVIKLFNCICRRPGTCPREREPLAFVLIYLSLRKPTIYRSRVTVFPHSEYSFNLL